ncbi:hypothetical protein ERJ75_001553700 [Trypanosoma vivax]|nr:hypothetical protein ERJ75_001553700 [Trypanosoma vivax]
MAGTHAWRVGQEQDRGARRGWKEQRLGAGAERWVRFGSDAKSKKRRRKARKTERGQREWSGVGVPFRAKSRGQKPKLTHLCTHAEYGLSAAWQLRPANRKEQRTDPKGTGSKDAKGNETCVRQLDVQLFGERTGKEGGRSEKERWQDGQESEGLFDARAFTEHSGLSEHERR